MIQALSYTLYQPWVCGCGANVQAGEVHGVDQGCNNPYPASKLFLTAGDSPAKFNGKEKEEMRNIATVIEAVLAAVPNPMPPEYATNLTVMVAELKVIERQAAYYPPEAEGDLWLRVGQVAYRYLPPPTAADWAMTISKILTGVE